ncbi:MAG: MmgE/PrpD family protein [Deltaproteobacteria bacterium]|nr:MAG: MmgE/PrpD family protein [Deltaproteobacteria bacterium]
MLTRRNLVQGAGVVLAGSVLPASGARDTPAVVPAKPASGAMNDLTGELALYMVAAREQNLPPMAMRDGKHRILDTLGAIVSGTRLRPGEAAIRFIRAQGGVQEASVLGTNIKTTAINAALANGMFAHADETDDVDPLTKAHPGAGVVPAALAMAEKEQRSGLELLRAVVLGYDVGCRFVIALGHDAVRKSHRAIEGPVSTMGGMAAAASLARLGEEGMRYAISYGAQQISGLWSWVEDHEHIEKAFDIGGMGARNGVTAAVMVQSGCTAVRDVLTCRHNALQALSANPRPEEMMAGMGTRFFVSETGIKTFPVGYPNQAPLDALLTLRRQHDLRPDNVERIVVRLPEDAPGIVGNSGMPDVNCQHLIATALVDGGVSFEKSHSREHMSDPQISAIMKRVQVVGDPKLNDPAAPRSGLVEVTRRDGKTVTHFTRFPPGTKENPLDSEKVSAKARDLMTPVLGASKTEAVIEQVNGLEKVANVRDLIRSLVTA